jgi:TRAP-type C4-dicarboxylate transport system permease small subunit
VTRKIELPESLGWYRESAQWLLTLALGALTAFGGIAGFSEKLSRASTPLKEVYLTGGLALAAAVAGGIFFYLYLTQYGNLLENQAKLQDELESAEAKSDAAEATKKREALRANKDTRVLVKTNYRIAYRVLLVGFFLSLSIFAITGAWLLLSSQETADTVKYEWAVQPNCEPFGTPRFYVLEKKSGRIFYFSLETNDWIRVAGPPPPAPR